MKLIGKGAFTKAYLNDNGKTVTLYSVCPIKECMALGGFPKSPLFPKLERIDYLDSGEGVYIMEYYPKVKSLKNALYPNQYAIYRELRGLRGLKISLTQNPYDGYRELYNAFKALKNRRVREVMLYALEACANYGSDIGFEISPRNVAVKNKKLVLLDCFFINSKLNEVRSKKR